jgi:hypothetical protein
LIIISTIFAVCGNKTCILPRLPLTHSISLFLPLPLSLARSMENTNDMDEGQGPIDRMDVDNADTGDNRGSAAKRPRPLDIDDDEADLMMQLQNIRAKKARIQAETDVADARKVTQVASNLSKKILSVPEVALDGTPKETVLATQLAAVLTTPAQKRTALSKEERETNKRSTEEKQNMVIIHVATSLLMPFRRLRLLKNLYVSRLTDRVKASPSPRDAILHFIVDGLAQLRKLEGDIQSDIGDSQWKQAYVFVNKTAAIKNALPDFVTVKSGIPAVQVIPSDPEATEWDQKFNLQRTSRLVFAYLASYETDRMMHDGANPFYDSDEGRLIDNKGVGPITDAQREALGRLYLTMLRGHFLFRDNDELLGGTADRKEVSVTSKAYGVIKEMVTEIAPDVLLNLIAELVAEILLVDRDRDPGQAIQRELTALSPHLPVDFGVFFLKHHGQTSPVFLRQPLFDLMGWRHGDANTPATFDTYKDLYKKSTELKMLIETHAQLHLRSQFKLKAFQVEEVAAMYKQETLTPSQVKEEPQRGRRGLLFNIPPGSGKTLLALFGAHFCDAMIRNEGRSSTLFIVPSSALASFEDTIRDMFNPGFLAYRYEEGKFHNIRKTVESTTGDDTKVSKDTKEMDKFFHQAEISMPDVVIVSHTKFTLLDPNPSTTGERDNVDYRKIFKPTWERVIVDESHLLNNILHIKSLKLERLSRHATYLMTGTLIIRKPEDAVAQVRILGYRASQDEKFKKKNNDTADELSAWDEAVGQADVKTFFANRIPRDKIKEKEREILKLNDMFFKGQKYLADNLSNAIKAGVHRYVPLKPQLDAMDVELHEVTIKSVSRFDAPTGDAMDIDATYETLKSRVDSVRQSALETRVLDLWSHMFKARYLGILQKLQDEINDVFTFTSVKKARIVMEKKADIEAIIKTDAKTEKEVREKLDHDLLKEFNKEEKEAEEKAKKGEEENDKDVGTIYLDKDLRKELYIINQFMPLPFDIHALSVTSMKRLKNYVTKAIAIIEIGESNKEQSSTTTSPSTGLLGSVTNKAKSLGRNVASWFTSSSPASTTESAEVRLLREMKEFLVQLDGINSYDIERLETHPKTTDASVAFAQTQLELAGVRKGEPPSARIEQLLTLVEGFLALDKKNKMLVFFNNPGHMYLFGHWLLVRNDKARLMIESATAPPPLQGGEDSDPFYYTYYDRVHDQKIRRNIQRQFNTNPSVRVCLMTYAVGATGLNLQGANGVVFSQPPETYAEYRQAYSRAYREGARSPNVYLYNFALDKSPEMVRNGVRQYYQMLEADLNDVYGQLKWDANGGQ